MSLWLFSNKYYLILSLKSINKILYFNIKQNIMESKPLHQLNQNIESKTLLDQASNKQFKNISQDKVFSLNFSSDRNKDINVILSQFACENCKESKQLRQVFNQFYDVILNLKIQKKNCSKLLKSLKQQVKKEKDHFEDQKLQYQSLTQIYQKELRNLSKMYQLCSIQLEALKANKNQKSQNIMQPFSPKQFSSPIKYFQKSLQKKVSQTEAKRNNQNSFPILKSEKINKTTDEENIKTTQFQHQISLESQKITKKMRQSSKNNSKFSSRVSKLEKQDIKQRQNKWNNSINLQSKSRKSKDLKIAGLQSSRKMI